MPRPRGHRRVSNDLFLRHRPLKRPYTVLEALLSIDFDCYHGGLLSVNAYARIFGHSRNWVRTRIGQYVDSQEDRKDSRLSATMDSDRTGDGQAMDSDRTPSKSLILDPMNQSQEKKKSPRIRSDPAPWAMTLSALLIDELKGVPGASFTRGCEKRWAREIEALVREVPELQGHQDPAEPIAEMIRWALGQENLGRPYAVVIRSGASLREKWPKLVAARQRRDAYDEDRDGIGPRLMRELERQGGTG